MDGYLEIITHEFSIYEFLEATVRNRPETLVEEIRKVAAVDAAEVPHEVWSIPIESIESYIPTFTVLVDLAKIAIPSLAGVLGTWILANAKKKIILRRGRSTLEIPASKVKEIEPLLTDFIDRADKEIAKAKAEPRKLRAKTERDS